MTQHEVPIGKAKAGAALECGWEPKALDAAMDYGLNRASLYQYRKRHPETRTWSWHKIAEKVYENKKLGQSAIAYQQGFGEHGQFLPGKVTSETAAKLPVSYWRTVATKINNISRKTFDGRLRDWGDPVRAATQPLRKGTKRGPTRKPTRARLERELGLAPGSIRTWERRHPGSGKKDREIAEIVAENKRKRKNSLNKRARRCRKKPSTVRKRLASGIELRDALLTPVKSPEEVRHEARQARKNNADQKAHPTQGRVNKTTSRTSPGVN